MIFHTKQTLLITIMACISLFLACRGETSSQLSGKLSHRCLDEKKISFLLKKFRQSDQKYRTAILSNIESSEAYITAPPRSSIRQLAAYFSDMVNSQANKGQANADFSRQPWREVSASFTPSDIPPKEAIPYRLGRPVLWNGLPIPSKFTRQQNALYRGDIDLLPDPLQPLKSTANIRKIFSQGILIDRKGLMHPASLHGDLFKHTMNSIYSSLLSASKDFNIATQFGFDKYQLSSAIIEFRGTGIDIHRLSRYFDNLPALGAPKSTIPREKEFTITEHIPAGDIRGLWIINSDGEEVFMKNPNWQEITN